jgi:hypothetical protein
MPAVSSAWLVAAVTIPQQTWTFDGAVATLAAGTYYLRHATAGRSLIAAFDAANLAATPTTVTSTTTVMQNRRVNITRSSAAAIAWGSATILRDLLGFVGDLGASTSSDASSISPMLWSPGYPATPKTISGVLGYTKPHQVRLKSDDGTRVRTVRFSSETQQDLSWQHIVPSRLRVSSGLVGGTFHTFYESHIGLGYYFFLYEQVTEDSGSSTPVTWPSGLGPYALRDGFDGDWYMRNVENAEISSPLKLPLHCPSEYT